MTEFTHGGHLRKLAQNAGLSENDVLDFSANINPLGPPEWLRPLISSQVAVLRHYPDPDCLAARKAVSTRYGASLEEVIVGNGSTEILYLLPRVISQRRAVVMVPAYTDYARAAAQGGMEVSSVTFEQGLDSTPIQDSLVFIGRPNNPTGHVFDADTIRRLAGEHPTSLFVVDEAFGDFVEGFDSLTRERPANVLVLLSLTKLFAIPGLRLGCAIGDPQIVQRMRELQPTWSVNTLAQAVGVRALSDTDYICRTRRYVKQAREKLAGDLRSIPGVSVFPGEANFLLARIEGGALNARVLAERLLSSGIAIRTCEDFKGLDERCFRLAVRTEEENARLITELRDVFNARPTSPAKRRRARAIMFQGTSSNAGKSVLAAAICRILQQDGHSVAPFKSQNMSLNSFVTRDGREMGRAQVVQAQACRLEPDARMNPILLKPNSDTGSQVILLGKPVGNMDVTAYIRFKPQAFAVARQAYDELASEHDIVVLEGAGSPAEVNLKRHDIVNMSMARYAEAPVLVVGDIDRGGVFASFVGTMEVLAEWERALVAGFVVNRFRGQAALLKDALGYTENHTGKSVLGVVPFLPHLRLPEEDSVSFKQQTANELSGAAVDIAVIDLPHISNFTDFDALRVEPDVNVRIVRSADELGTPDAVILPGSKNVVADLNYLRQHGLATALSNLRGAEVVGICGGYQMLGEKTSDPYGIESGVRTTGGLGLLPLTTVMAPDKTLQRIGARHRESGFEVQGYEIHHGQTVSTQQLVPVFFRADGEAVGLASSERPIWGTYLHGVFDADEFRRWFVDRLRVRRGLAPVGKVVAVYDLQQAFDELADVVRQSLDMKQIYRLLRLQ